LAPRSWCCRLLAEEAATIDLMPNGRLEFGVAKGLSDNEFAGFCIPVEEADERFEEGLTPFAAARLCISGAPTMACLGPSLAGNPDLCLAGSANAGMTSCTKGAIGPANPARFKRT
jgi:alkanesulfonate monooxygenase SsuD/methylene tetrahydromethanopterin reductase-like flavin-dependent oxidoreductase (luciferase family)